MEKPLYEMRSPLYKTGLEDLINYIDSRRPVNSLTMVEIGSYAGESTEIFSKRFKQVVSIDPFISGYDEKDPVNNYRELEQVYEVFSNKIKQLSNVSHIRKTSDEAVNLLKGNKFDFVYIDGLHTYTQVLKDIRKYLPLLVEDGFIGGHDYHPVWQGVIKAVEESIGTPDQTFVDTSWIVQLPLSK